MDHKQFKDTALMAFSWLKHAGTAAKVWLKDKKFVLEVDMMYQTSLHQHTKATASTLPRSYQTSLHHHTKATTSTVPRSHRGLTDYLNTIKHKQSKDMALMTYSWLKHAGTAVAVWFEDNMVFPPDVTLEAKQRRKASNAELRKGGMAAQNEQIRMMKRFLREHPLEEWKKEDRKRIDEQKAMMKYNADKMYAKADKLRAKAHKIEVEVGDMCKKVGGDDKLTDDMNAKVNQMIGKAYKLRLEADEWQDMGDQKMAERAATRYDWYEDHYRPKDASRELATRGVVTNQASEPGHSGENVPRPESELGHSGENVHRPKSEPGHSGENVHRPESEPGHSGENVHRPESVFAEVAFEWLDTMLQEQFEHQRRFRESLNGGGVILGEVEDNEDEIDGAEAVAFPTVPNTEPMNSEDIVEDRELVHDAEILNGEEVTRSKKVRFALA